MTRSLNRKSQMPTGFSITHRVQFSETDMAGIMHFSNFFKMMEEVEHAFFRSVGLSVSMQHDDIHIGWPRVSASCEFFGPVKFEDEVEVKMNVTRVGDKSFSYGVEFLVNSKRVALGKTTSVCCDVDSDDMHSINIPVAIREKLLGGNSK
jgi:acyl-CoA thioester hydrolase